MGLQQRLLQLRPQLVAAAQKCYDEWDQSDPEYGDPLLGFGGLCGEMAEALRDVLDDEGMETFPLPSDDHEAVAVSDGCEMYGVDIPYSLYEIGAGYIWKKIPGVRFQEEHLDFWELDEELMTCIRQGDFD